MHPPVGSSAGSDQDLSSPVVGGEETGVQLHSDNLQHLLLIPLTFSLDAVPATCLFLAGAAAASASAGRRCARVPAQTTAEASLNPLFQSWIRSCIISHKASAKLHQTLTVMQIGPISASGVYLESFPLTK